MPLKDCPTLRAGWQLSTRGDQFSSCQYDAPLASRAGASPPETCLTGDASTNDQADNRLPVARLLNGALPASSGRRANTPAHVYKVRKWRTKSQVLL